jgi:hypothetical protein
MFSYREEVGSSISMERLDFGMLIRFVKLKLSRRYFLNILCTEANEIIGMPLVNN